MTSEIDAAVQTDADMILFLVANRIEISGIEEYAGETSLRKVGDAESGIACYELTIELYDQDEHDAYGQSEITNENVEEIFSLVFLDLVYDLALSFRWLIDLSFIKANRPKE